MTTYADLPSPSPATVDADLTLPASATGALFSLEGATEGTTQWRAEQMQLVHWGGFTGFTPITFDPDTTLLSGQSGTGKSTLLDAYTALMMPSDVPFNGASNDSVGRARGTEQRSLVSYLRGQTDIIADGEGDERAQVLRGETGPTWGGVAMVFVNDHGDAFTAARLYYLPASARLGGDVTQRMLTFDGRLNLRDFEAFFTDAFPPQKLKAAFPGLTTHDTYQGFAARLYTRLGIGANGDGDKALHLLARVQAGHQIRTVDALYKEMVLETPATYAAADRALAHFDALADTYHHMEAERRKLSILAPITATWQRHQGALDAAASIDAFGATHDGPSPLTLWSLRREADMVAAAEMATQVRHAAAVRTAEGAASAHHALKAHHAALTEAHLAAGGADMQAMTATIAAARADEVVRQRALDGLAAKVTAVAQASDLADQDGFDALLTRGQVFLAGHAAAAATRDGQLEQLNEEQWALQSRKMEASNNLNDLEGKQSRITPDMTRVRREVCAATGMTEQQLPYLAELIDVADHERPWRVAIETCLGGDAHKILVPEDRFEEFSRAIDPLHLNRKVQFIAAALDSAPAPAPAPGTVASKLMFQASPFHGWVTHYVGGPTRNALCVAAAADLNGPGLRVTAAGQQRRGRSGSHGRNNSRNILGFSNADLVGEARETLATLTGELAALGTQKDTLARAGALARAQHEAFLVLSGASFAQIDVGTPQTAIRRATAAIEAIVANNDQLIELQNQLTATAADVAAANIDQVLTAKAVDDLDKAWSSLVERKDGLSDQVARLERSQAAELTEAQNAALERHFHAACAGDDPEDLDRFATHQAHLRKQLVALHTSANNDVATTTKELTRIFEQFLEQFHDPNLGTGLASYPDFAQILDDIQTVGLHARLAEWRERVMAWSGQDLVPLAHTMQTALDDIAERMDPINDILLKLPFGAMENRLRMHPRRLTRDQVATFRRDLTRLSSDATKPVDEARMTARFLELEAFMGKLRAPKDPRYNAKVSVRDEVLDVRRHVEIRAQRIDGAGQVLSNYTSLGSKSGGETQELIAFIVGAALRFRLGDEDRARPRFAPVFLDEGFIKADADFASRAVKAWTGLGFQLIVGAPTDKVAALEPHMAAFLIVTKDLTTMASQVRHITDAERAVVRRGAPPVRSQ